MKLTNTVFEYHACPRCGGEGYIYQFHHNKGGECFCCHGTGKAAPVAVEIPMTDEEVIEALETAGFSIMMPDTGDWLADMFISPDAIAGARALLAAI